MNFLMILGGVTKNGRHNPVIARQLRTVLKASGIKRGKGDKQNLQLLYELAVWLLGQWREDAATPVCALRAFQDDTLFDILQRHGQIARDSAWWDSIPKHELRKLEKRLHQQWPTVERVALALEAPHKRMTSSRRKPRTAMQHMASWNAGAAKS